MRSEVADSPPHLEVGMPPDRRDPKSIKGKQRCSERCFVCGRDTEIYCTDCKRVLCEDHFDEERNHAGECVCKDND